MGAFSTTRRLPSFDDLTFIPCTLSRVPLEGYREKCETGTVLGTRAANPVRLSTPICISGMSFGALSANAKEALGRAASIVGTSTTTGDGGMHRREREASKTLVYQVTPSHYGNNPHHMRQADAVEIVIGQGAKPGTGGVLLGFKVSDEVASMRDLPRRRRPALPGPPPGLHRGRRPAAQDRGDPRGDRPPDPGLREDRRLPGLRRRPARREGRGGRDRHRRDGGRDGRVSRCSSSTTPAYRPWRRSWRRARRSSTSACYGDLQIVDRGRHPLRHRRGEGARPRRRRGLHCHRRHDRAQLQRAALRRGLREARRDARHVPRVPHGPLPGRASPPRIQSSWRASKSRPRRSGSSTS